MTRNLTIVFPGGIMVRPSPRLLKAQEGWGLCAHKPAYGLLSLLQNTNFRRFHFLADDLKPCPTETLLYFLWQWRQKQGLSSSSAQARQVNSPQNLSTSTMLLSPNISMGPVTDAVDQQQEGTLLLGQLDLI